MSYIFVHVFVTILGRYISLQSLGLHLQTQKTNVMWGSGITRETLAQILNNKKFWFFLLDKEVSIMIFFRLLFFAFISVVCLISFLDRHSTKWSLLCLVHVRAVCNHRMMVTGIVIGENYDICSNSRRILKKLFQHLKLYIPFIELDFRCMIPGHKYIAEDSKNYVISLHFHVNKFLF